LLSLHFDSSLCLIFKAHPTLSLLSSPCHLKQEGCFAIVDHQTNIRGWMNILIMWFPQFNEELKHIRGVFEQYGEFKQGCFSVPWDAMVDFFCILTLYPPHRWRCKWIYWPWGTQKMLTKADAHFKRGSWGSFPLLRHWQFNEFNVLRSHQSPSRTFILSSQEHPP
jgi:hypothetical protein